MTYPQNIIPLASLAYLPTYYLLIFKVICMGVYKWNPFTFQLDDWKERKSIWVGISWDYSTPIPPPPSK